MSLFKDIRCELISQLFNAPHVQCQYFRPSVVDCCWFLWRLLVMFLMKQVTVQNNFCGVNFLKPVGLLKRLNLQFVTNFTTLSFP